MITQRRERTLSHKIFQVVPLNVIRQVADIDPAILLRLVTDVVHHLLASDGSILERALWLPETLS